jgi:Domain of unknown function (DUF4214)
MAFMEEVKGAWHNHPYIILGGGAVIALYFLWPKSTASTATTTSGLTDYQAQLAAQTALAQTQLGTQAAVGMNQQNMDAATAANASNNSLASLLGLAAADSANKLTAAQLSAAQSGGNSTTDQTGMIANANTFGGLATALTNFGNQGVNVTAIQSQNVQSLLGSGAVQSSPGLLSQWMSILTGGGTLDATGTSNIADYAPKNVGAAPAVTDATPVTSSLITDMYNKILGRAPDPAGLAYWSSGAGSTNTATQIEAAFVGDAGAKASGGGAGNFTYTPGPQAFQPDLLAGLWKNLATAQTAQLAPTHH